ncbi:MFS transporter [Gemmatimonas sp.]|uniref:MFS transporter n=1 Tax=Gemmatimonas sp. TaxID=1962908 RepID=UPI0035684674
MSVLLGGTFIGTINNSIANVAVPSMADDLGVDLSTAVWIISGFALALGTLMSVAGRLGDMYGPRRLFLAGMFVFSFASLIVAIGDHILVVVGGRVLQGASGAPVLPCILATIARMYEKEDRGAPVALWAAVNAAALAAGPAVGGVIVDAFGWRAIFFMTAPAMLLVGVLVVFLVPPDEPVERQRLDGRGALLVALTLACFAIPVTEASRWGWTSSSTIGLLGASIGLGLVLRRHLSRTPEPFIDPGLLRQPGFASVTTVASLQMVVLFTVTFSVPVFFVVGAGQSAGSAGLTTSVLPVCMFVGAIFAGRLIRRSSLRNLLMVGALLMAAGTIAVAAVAPSMVGVGLALIPIGIGVSLIQTPSASAVTILAPSEQTGEAAGVFNTARFVLGGLGATLAAVLFDLGAGREPGAQVTLEQGLRGLTAALGLALAASTAIVVVSLRSTFHGDRGLQDDGRQTR